MDYVVNFEYFFDFLLRLQVLRCHEEAEDPSTN